MKTDFFHLMPLAEVVRVMRGLPAAVRLLPPETVSLADGLGRVPASDVTSPEDLPGWPRSAMDGYAVAAADVFGVGETNPGYLDLAGRLAVDEVPSLTLAPGQCAAILTGGRLPEGADAVVMQEYAQEMPAGPARGSVSASGSASDGQGALVEIRRPVFPGENVLLRGEDIRAGEPATPAGRRLRPQDLGLLAALGVDRLEVRPVPRVAILSTGDEIAPPGSAPVPPGKIRDVNGPALLAWVRQAGFAAEFLGLVPDDRDQLRRALAGAVASFDLVLVSGGSSVGTRDMTIAALGDLPGAELLIHGVAISPGKPTILATVPDNGPRHGNGVVPVLGLPGQTASAQVVLRILGLPLMRWLGGETEAFVEVEFDQPPAMSAKKASIVAELAQNVAGRPGREDFVRARLTPRPGALPLATPVFGKSGLLRTLLGADGLIRVPSNVEGLYQGSLVSVIAL